LNGQLRERASAIRQGQENRLIYIVIFILLIAIIAGPNLWIKHVLQKYSKHLDAMPGTGGELAQHLIERYELQGVEVEKTEPGTDHYSPDEKRVRLSPNIFDGKSLTAVAVAAHEVGHAIQYARGEKITHLRQSYTPMAVTIQRLGAAVVMAAPVVLAIFHVPHAAIFTVLCGVAAMLASALLQLIILPMEWDASFNKAMPILFQGNYVPEQYQPVIKKILTAAALTYFAGALINVLQLWRWLAILRGVVR